MGVNKPYSATALHEAGHAFFAWLGGELLDHTTITGDLGQRAYCRHSSMAEIYQRPPLNARAAFIGIGGAAAARLFDQDSGPSEADKVYLKRTLENHPCPDTQAMWKWQIENPGGDPDVFMETFMPRALEILSEPRIKSCLEAGAALLDLMGEASGWELAKLFEFTHGEPLPPYIMDAELHTKPKKPKTVMDYRVELFAELNRLDEKIDALRWAASKENNPAAEKLAEAALRFKFEIDGLCVESCGG
jgi:hypothetical protein